MAEQVTGATNFEVAHGNFETTAEGRVVANRAQTFEGRFTQRLVGGVKQVGVRALATSTNASTQLMELTQAESIGAVDNHRVHRRQVDAGLDDCRADQHVKASLPKVNHHSLECAFIHLAVRDNDASIGHQLSDAASHLVNIGDAVVDEKDLAFTQQFTTNSLDYCCFAVLTYVGQDGASIGGRRRHHRQVANTSEGHFQRTRNRARRQREHVNTDRTRFDGLLVRHTETLLFVDDEETEIFEFQG